MVSVFEIFAILYPVFIFLNGALGLGTKYLQWKKYSLSETLYTFVGVIFGALGVASGVAMFHYEYGDIFSRIILITSAVHMFLRPLRHRKWAAMLSVGVGIGMSYGAVKYYGPVLAVVQQGWLEFFNTQWFFDPVQMSILFGLVSGALMYPILKFVEDLLGTTSNIMDHWAISLPLGALSIIEGVVTGVPPHLSVVTYVIYFFLGGG